MSPFIRLNHNYFFLIASLLAVALFCQLKTPRASQPSLPQDAPPTAQMTKQARQDKALGQFVGGAIGIQEERGDSVFIYSR